MKLVKISTEKPPQWILDAVKEKWGVDWESRIVFTYDGVISTSTGEITEDLLAHENHHIEQQGDDPDGWWKRYLEDAEFRYAQELECYQKQYQWLLKHEPNRQKRFEFLQHYARCLAGEMYGNLVTQQQARRSIIEIK